MATLDARGWVALLCSELLLLNLSGCGSHRVALPSVTPPPEVFNPLQRELKKSYLELFGTEMSFEYSDSQISTMREYQIQAQDYCVGRFEGLSKEYERKTDEAQKS